MRKNFPITQTETRLRADQYLISRTDTKGIITYANPAFTEVSGYTREELVGKPHNLVRHPDMPPAAFEDLWDTLAAGKPWMGMVKNRRKDGGFYWVLANVTPIVEDGEVTGYTSVRIKPARSQIAEADALYRSINDGTLRGYTVREGELVPTGWRRALRAAGMPFRSEIRAQILRMTALSCATTAAAVWFAVNGGLPESYRMLASAMLSAGVMGTVLSGWRISCRATRPLRDVTHIARQIAAGGLQLQIDTTHSGDIGKLYFYMEMMRRSLVGIAHDVLSSVTTVTRTSEILHLDNRNLALRTEEQSDALQETAASMEELTATVRQNADHAVLAKELSDNSMQIAQRGGAVVNAVVQSMGRIHESSQEIGDIVALIESIAFQTNILALNAAVEAARAGEAGRGFAVVASEVRNLAQKSAQAAKEIKTLIGESVTRMQDGAREADHAGKTMQEIVEAVTRVTELIGEISVASAEQTSGLDQINQAVNHLEGNTQQNEHFGRQLGENIDLLAREAETLRCAIGVLSTGEPDILPPSRGIDEARTDYDYGLEGRDMRPATALPGSSASRHVALSN